MHETNEMRYSKSFLRFAQILHAAAAAAAFSTQEPTANDISQLLKWDVARRRVVDAHIPGQFPKIHFVLTPHPAHTRIVYMNVRV